jgi:uncharacterized membrane protein YhfC
VKHLDETGNRMGSLIQRLLVAAITRLICYRATRRRRDIVMDIAGIIVHALMQCAPSTRVVGAV